MHRKNGNSGQNLSTFGSKYHLGKILQKQSTVNWNNPCEFSLIQSPDKYRKYGLMNYRLMSNGLTTTKAYYRLSQKKWHGSVGSVHSMLNSLGLTHCALFTVLDFSLAAIAHYIWVETKSLITSDATLALSYRSRVISSGTIYITLF